MPRQIDLVGQQFGRLTVRRRVERGADLRTRLLCVCACGAEVIVRQQSLRSGDTKSCGCLQREAYAAGTGTTHGKAGTREYKAWGAMVQRCTNPKDARYKWYGGRGIRIAPSFLKFENFYAVLGDCPPGKTLDRYPNNDGHYEPGNVRWATMKEQAANRRQRRAA